MSKNDLPDWKLGAKRSKLDVEKDLDELRGCLIKAEDFMKGALKFDDPEEVLWFDDSEEEEGAEDFFEECLGDYVWCVNEITHFIEAYCKRFKKSVKDYVDREGINLEYARF